MLYKLIRRNVGIELIARKFVIDMLKVMRRARALLNLLISILLITQVFSPIRGKAQTNYTEEQLKSWFTDNCTMKDVTIKIQVETTKNAPHFTVKENNACNRPELYFYLTGAAGLGGEVSLRDSIIAGLGNGFVATYLLFNADRVWFSFKARLGSFAGAEVKNLGFLVGDTVGAMTGFNAGFYYGEGGETNHRNTILASDQSGDVTTRTLGSGRHPLEESVIKLGTFVNDYTGSPSRENCRTDESAREFTGPKDFSNNTREMLWNHDDPNRGNDPINQALEDDPSKLNSNCLNGSSEGWLKYWGVEVYVSGSLLENTFGECSLGRLFSAAGDIGAVFSAFIKCIVYSIFVPIIEWAATKIQEAAGISMNIPNHPKNRNYPLAGFT